MSSSTTSVVTPNARRCAATAQNAATTPGASRAARAPSASPEATARRAWAASRRSSGPSEPRAIVVATTTMTTEPTPATIVVHAASTSAGPRSPRRPMAQPAPIAAATAPDVVTREFAPTRCSEATTWGSAAESPAWMKRLTPIVARAPRYRGGPVIPASTTPAVASVSTPRRAPATTRTRRRSQRSSRAPANGPIREYGSRTVARPRATMTGSASRSGLNSTSPPSAAWNTPSPHWAASRTVSRRPKPGCRSSSRRRPVRPAAGDAPPTVAAVVSDATGTGAHATRPLRPAAWCSGVRPAQPPAAVLRRPRRRCHPCVTAR